MKSPKIEEKSCIMLYQVVEIFKNVKFLHPMKRILNLFSRLGGINIRGLDHCFQVVEIFKNVKFLHPMKQIRGVISTFVG